MDDLKKLGFEPRLVWAAKEGIQIGPVPADWDAPFGEDGDE